MPIHQSGADGTDHEVLDSIPCETSTSHKSYTGTLTSDAKRVCNATNLVYERMLFDSQDFWDGCTERLLTIPFGERSCLTKQTCRIFQKTHNQQHTTNRTQQQYTKCYEWWHHSTSPVRDQRENYQHENQWHQRIRIIIWARAHQRWEVEFVS